MQLRQQKENTTELLNVSHDLFLQDHEPRPITKAIFNLRLFPKKSWTDRMKVSCSSIR